MKIGIVAEGSYPFIKGGVASWVHMLISGLPDIEFEIISIMPPDLKDDTNYKYELPKNVTNVSLYKLGQTRSRRSIPPKLTKEEEQYMTGWFQFQNTSERSLDLLGDRERLGTSEEFFYSKAFWRIVTESYKAEGQASSFIDYFWMYRSMNEFVITLLQNDFPKVDIVHAVSTGYAGLLASYIKTTQQVPYLLTEHGIYSREREEEILRAGWIPNIYKKRWIQYFHHLSKQSYDSADDVITLFERNSFYQKELGAPEHKLKIVPNGIHYDRLSQVRRTDSSRILEIGAIVRIVPIKDIKTMIYAAKMLADDEVEFHLSIMGPLDEEPEYAKECMELVERLNVSSFVTFTGQVNIIEYLSKFDLLLLTSISEGQPLAVLEGMAAGIPWVVTDVGSCAELLFGRNGDSFGQAGFVVPPVNPRAIAEKCRWVAEHRDEAAQFGQNGKRRVQKEYQLQQVIDMYRALYEERGGIVGRHRV